MSCADCELAQEHFADQLLAAANGTDLADEHFVSHEFYVRVGTGDLLIAGCDLHVRSLLEIGVVAWVRGRRLGARGPRS